MLRSQIPYPKYILQDSPHLTFRKSKFIYSDRKQISANITNKHKKLFRIMKMLLSVLLVQYVVTIMMVSHRPKLIKIIHSEYIQAIVINDSSVKLSETSPQVSKIISFKKLTNYDTVKSTWYLASKSPKNLEQSENKKQHYSQASLLSDMGKGDRRTRERTPHFPLSIPQACFKTILLVVSSYSGLSRHCDIITCSAGEHA